MRRIIVFVALSMLIAACGDDDSSVTTGASSQSNLATTSVPTTALATTTTPTTSPTTTQSAELFTTTDLPTAVLMDGDPWTSPVAGVEDQPLTIDDIWPVSSDDQQFADEREIYESAGFVDGWFSYFAEPDGALVLSGSHLFATPEGAATGLEVIEASFSDLDLVARITSLAPGSLNMLFPMPVPVGDDGAGMLASGPTAQVVGMIWITDNLLQFVRVGMPLGDEDRTAAVVTLTRAIAERTTGR